MTGKRHLSRLAAPRTWPIERKKTKWIARPNPGPHKLKNCMPLIVILRDILKHANTKREINYILNNKEVLINKSPKKDPNYPVGLFDILEIPKLNEYYIIIFNKKGKISLEKISKEDSKLRISKITGKTTIRNGKTQVNLFDGNNYLLDKDNYKVGDSLVIDLETKKIKSHLSLEKGAVIFLIGGSHVGYVGIVKEIIRKKDLQKPKIIYEINKETHQTLRDYAFVVGKEKSLLPIKK